MCSVSWLLEENGYQVFFNRDEQKTRALAMPPRQYQVNGVDIIMPLDPTGGGSWISINEFGLSLCLLNNYQGIVPDGPLISRGLLLKNMSSSRNIVQLTEAFHRLELSSFAPFTLLAFAPNLTQHNGVVVAYKWDGVQQSIVETDSPLFSSGVDLARVQAYRQAKYDQLISTGKNQQNLLMFHSHHHSEQPHLGTCMHRSDAHTVSFTHLRNRHGQASMFYVPGAPCEPIKPEQINQQRFTFDFAPAINL
ncbi:NRDE family protein [Vibrio fortis]|uniref:NRDE family protein n=1 Tax=Vibrio fortis TaxID=212667 RepID=UPI002F40F045